MMRDDQKQRLLDLQESLLDVFLDEANPTNWSGAGKVGAQMTQQERGNRHWDKKSAAGTMMVLAGVEKLVANTKEALGREPYTDDDMDQQIKRAEAEARRRTDEVIKQTAKAAFDAKTHGKPH